MTLRDAVLHAWSEAIGTIWTVFTPLSGFALILTLFLREYSLDRKTVRAGDAKTLEDPETGAVPNDKGDLHGQKPWNDDPEMTPTNTVVYREEGAAMD